MSPSPRRGLEHQNEAESPKILFFPKKVDELRYFIITECFKLRRCPFPSGKHPVTENQIIEKCTCAEVRITFFFGKPQSTHQQDVQLLVRFTGQIELDNCILNIFPQIFLSDTGNRDPAKRMTVVPDKAIIISHVFCMTGRRDLMIPEFIVKPFLTQIADGNCLYLRQFLIVISKLVMQLFKTED